MSFWEDASPVVKGAIVFGIVGLLYFGAAAGIGLPPFGGGDDAGTRQTRGLDAPGAGATAEAE